MDAIFDSFHNRVAVLFNVGSIWLTGRC